MMFSLNGAPAVIEDDAPKVACSIDSVIKQLVTQSQGIAVALNGEVVPRSDWQSTFVKAADQIEVLTAAQGG